MTKEEFFLYVFEEYDVEPDYPFTKTKDKDTATFRHKRHKKWFALVMDIPKSKLGLDSLEVSTVVNMKYSEDMLLVFGRPRGVYPAYHMNKVHWVSVLLDTADDETIKLILEESYNLTKK